MDLIINKVANSNLKTVHLDDFYPKDAMISLDLKDFLFKGLLLKEKDFRQSMKTHNWADYEGKILLIECSSDAIIPLWAYMLVTSLAGEVKEVFIGSKEDYLVAYYRELISNMSVDEYRDERLVVKGCGNEKVPPQAYASFTQKVKPIAKSIMFGEPCSTVPIYKSRK